MSFSFPWNPFWWWRGRRQARSAGSYCASRGKTLYDWGADGCASSDMWQHCHGGIINHRSRLPPCFRYLQAVHLWWALYPIAAECGTICPTVGIFEQCTIAAELEIVTRFDGCLVFEHFTSARSNVTPDSYCASETYDVAGWSVRIVGWSMSALADCLEVKTSGCWYLCGIVCIYYCMCM